jgi:hypothetical protein
MMVGRSLARRSRVNVNRRSCRLFATARCLEPSSVDEDFATKLDLLAGVDQVGAIGGDDLVQALARSADRGHRGLKPRRAVDGEELSEAGSRGGRSSSTASQDSVLAACGFVREQDHLTSARTPITTSGEMSVAWRSSGTEEARVLVMSSGGFIQRVVYSVPSGLMATGSMSASTTIASIASSAPHLS